MSKIEVDKVDPQSGTALEIGTSGDTITVPTGAGLTVVDEVKTNKISPATGTAFALGDSGDTFTVPSGATIVNSGTATGFGGGGLLQIKQTVVTTETALAPTPGTFVDISGMSVSITPTLSTSKIFILVDISTGSTGAYGTNFRLLRDSTDIYQSTDASGSQLNTTFSSIRGGIDSSNQFKVPMMFIDAPSSTSATAYKVQWSGETGSALKLNRSVSDADNNYTGRSASSITAIELAVAVL